MLKKDELIGPSCLTRAADDEPLFVLRANDDLAPGTVRNWANRYMLEKSGRPGKNLDRLTNAQKEKYLEAVEIAASMEMWKKGARR